MRTKAIQILKDATEKEKSNYLKDQTIKEYNEFKEFGTTKHPIRLQKLLIVVDDD